MANPAVPTLADKLFPEQDISNSDSILSIPPEQRRLHTDTYDFSIATIHQYLTSKIPHLFIPEFQRGYVWTKAQASRLIESLIIQCPIPVIYLSQERDERLSVIDGNQRLTSIRRFLDNEFELTGLTAYPELDGSYFDDLDARFKRHITNRTLRCIVIMKETHPQVKFDVFERLNTGAVELSPQELRNGIYHGSFAEWIAETAKLPSWKKLLHVRVNKRMKAEEFLVRFLAFHERLDHYEKPLASFLNKFSEDHRDASPATLASFMQTFVRTMNAVSSVLGPLSFSIFDARSGNRVLSKFNAALFDAQMLAFSRAELPRSIPAKVKNAFVRDLGDLFYDEKFARSIGRATSDQQALALRVRAMRGLVGRHFA